MGREASHFVSLDRIVINLKRGPDTLCLSGPVLDCRCRTEFGIGIGSRDLNGAIARPAKAEIREIREGEGREQGRRRRGIYKVCYHLSESGVRYKRNISESPRRFSIDLQF